MRRSTQSSRWEELVSSEGLNSALVSPAFGTNNAPISPGQLQRIRIMLRFPLLAFHGIASQGSNALISPGQSSIAL